MKSSTGKIATVAVMAAVIVVANFIDKAYSYGFVAIGGAALAVCALVAVVTSSLLFNKFYYALIAGGIFGFVSFVLSYVFINVVFQNPLVSLLPRLLIGIVGFGAYKFAQIVARGYAAFVKKVRIGFLLPMALLAAVLLAADIAGMVTFLVIGGAVGVVFFLCLSLFVLGALLSAGLLLAVIAVKRGGDGVRGREHFSLSVGAFFTVVANTVLVLPMIFVFSDQYQTLSDVYALLTILNFLPELLITTFVAPIVILGVRRGLRLGIDGKPRLKQRPAPDKDLKETETL